jgi:rare lipoprotein A
VFMPRNYWWSTSLVACQVLVLSTTLVKAHSRIPAREEVGLASWYGPRFHGRETASGERFSMYERTAAHRTLPLGTKVLVMNLETDASVEVKINDRGPYADEQRRIIDLSRAAADTLGLRERGVAPVRVVVSEEASAPQDAAEATVYEVQVGTFPKAEQAGEALAQLRRRYPLVYVTARQGPVGRYYRLRVGPFASRLQAQLFATGLQQEGYAVFVDAVPAHTLMDQAVDLVSEKHLRAITVVSRNEGNAARRDVVYVDSALIIILVLLVVGITGCLVIWTRYMVVSSRREKHAPRPIFDGSAGRPLDHPKLKLISSVNPLRLTMVRTSQL